MMNNITGLQQLSPAYSLIVDGKDISSAVEPRLISLSLADNRGFEADTVELTLDDSDGELALPRRGTKMQVSIGWLGQSLINKGLYTIDEVEHSGVPDVLTIRGKSADLRGTLLKQREQSYHQTTLGNIIQIVAGRHGLTAKIANQFSGINIEHLDQQNESDAAFITRLAQQYDAIATVKQNAMLFIKAGGSTTAGGHALQAVTIERKSGDGHQFSVADRDAYSGVIAYWHDTKKGQRQSVQAKKKQPAQTSDVKVAVGENELLVGNQDNVKTLRHIYASKKNAERAAKAEWEKLQRGVATFTITLAVGRPELFPEVPVKTKGFKPQIDAADWLLARVLHNITDSGYTNQLELEVKTSELPDLKEE